MIHDDQLLALKDRNPVHAVAAQWVTLRPMRGQRYVGPCPICSANSESRAAGRFECDADTWVCAVCADGGDVIRLVQKREGLDFRSAVERLGGVRAESPTPALAERAGLKAFRAGAAETVPQLYDDTGPLAEAWRAGWRKARRAADFEAHARERERKRLYAFWEASRPIARTPVETYFDGRGIVMHPRARLRFHPDMPLFCDGREHEPVIAHRGPAMLAAIVGAADGRLRFNGLHITWLDPRGPKGKAAVHHPETGMLLPAKKVRGSKAGGYIDLGCDGDPQRVIAGEGIESVGAAYTALFRTGRLRDGDCFRSSADLGNLAGRALHTIAHPTLKAAAGRAQRVPGPDPDMTSPAMPLPDTRELILIGDGDSDPFLTRNALERARRRHEPRGVRVGVSLMPPGIDSNDVIQGHCHD